MDDLALDVLLGDLRKQHEEIREDLTTLRAAVQSATTAVQAASAFGAQVALEHVQAVGRNFAPAMIERSVLGIAQCVLVGLILWRVW